MTLDPRLLGMAPIQSTSNTDTMRLPERLPPLVFSYSGMQLTN